MAKAKFTITGLKDVMDALKSLPDKVAKKHVRGALRKELKPIREELAATAPVGETEQLADVSNIKIRSAGRKKDGISMTVGYGKKDFTGGQFYAAFQEYGTSKMQDHPGKGWMRKVFDEKKEVVAHNLVNELWRRIDQEVAKSA